MAGWDVTSGGCEEGEEHSLEGTRLIFFPLVIFGIQF